MSFLFMETYIPLLTHFVKMCWKWRHPSLGWDLHFFIIMSIFLLHIAKCGQKYIFIIICILIRSTCYILNFMLPAYRPNFAEVSCTTKKVGQACTMHSLRVNFILTSIKSFYLHPTYACPNFLMVELPRLNTANTKIHNWIRFWAS